MNSSTVDYQTIETSYVPLNINGFSLLGVWDSDITYGSATNAIWPRIGTGTKGSGIRFNVTNASGFYSVGSVNFNHGNYTVTISPPANVGSPTTYIYNSVSRWIGLDVVNFLATGLDRSLQYEVLMTDINADFDISKVVLINTTPP